MSHDKGQDSTKPLFVVALASSAGGLAALSRILSGLPREFAAAIIVVQHVSPHHVSFLADILSRRTKLKVKQAEEDDVLKRSVVFIAPPDRHLLLKSQYVLTLSQSKPLHFLRPSADLLFDSLATNLRDRAIVVILTGTGTDGTSGVKSIKAFGGTVIAQDEKTSEFFGMPGSAIQAGYVDHILPIEKIAPFLEELIAARST